MVPMSKSSKGTAKKSAFAMPSTTDESAAAPSNPRANAVEGLESSFSQCLQELKVRSLDSIDSYFMLNSMGLLPSNENLTTLVPLLP